MRKSLFFGLVAILGLIGCSRNQEINVPDANLSLFARTESPAESRTVVESGVHVYWEPGDDIAVFMGEKSAKFTTDITAASGTATFKGTFGDSEWPEDLDLWAVYPFSEDAVFDGETITTTLPSEQVAREGSFGKDMNLAIAHSNSSILQFYNVGGGIRFSVLEEGIKKVMFEGLSGEIISGKVKIGMDENGKPEVREVTGGSQFITLLPPSGQETFEPGTWYYIVAIPGSLEGGYKLRFYKDSDYARKVSEKKVKIKRSIFGSLEKADSGIEYEATTTHFPETHDEIVASVELTEAIHKDVNYLLWEDSESEGKAVEDLVEEIQKIDGVVYAIENEDKTAISVIQRDSICVNYMLKSYSSDLLDSSTTGNLASTMPRKKVASINKTVQNLKDGKKALILAPFQWDFNADFAVNIENIWIPALAETFSDRIKYLPDDKAGILQFKEELHGQYDFILIDTHGTTGFCSHPVRVLGQTTTAPTWDSFLSTATVYSADVLEQMIKEGVISIKETGIITPPKSNVEYLGISTNVLEGASFDNSCVMILACESAKTLDKKKPWLDTFTSKGALVTSGACVSMDSKVLAPTADKLIQMMTLGCSFRDAFRYVTKSNIMSHWSNAVYEHVLKNEKVDYDGYDVYNQYIYKQNESKPTQDYFLSNPVATLNEPNIENEDIVFSWESFSLGFPKQLTWYYSVNQSTSKPEFECIVYNRIFDIYLDDNLIDIDYFESHDNSKQTVTCPKPASGSHKWRVITKIIEKESGKVIGEYSSGEESFTVKEESSGNNVIYYTSTDGQIINPRTTSFGVKLLSNEYINGKGVMTFDGPITYLGYGAFLQCSTLTSITIPETVSSLGDYCFHHCPSLTTINIPDIVTSMGYGCFTGCSSLASINIPSSVTDLGEMCFYGCSKLTTVTIPESVTSLNTACFQSCHNLVSINLPQTITSIGDYCFVGCSSLTSINIPESVTSIGDGCFSACSSLTSIILPKSITKLGSGFFDHCSNLKSVLIPESVTSLGDGCFWCCSSLISIVIPDSVTSLGKECFFGCTSLTSISIPNSISSIGDFCFHLCSSLTSFRIPESLTSLGEGCLYMCSSLTSITIPESITSIGEYCFSDCSSLTSIIVKPIMPPSGGTCMFQCTNGCPIYVPANSYYDYIEAPFWDEEAWRIQAMGGPNPNDEGVDLGLSVNWAAYNLGAWLPEEYGDYYAWGEPSSKQYFSWGNYDLCYGNMNSIWKYTYDDQLSTLDRYDDAATSNLEGNWRMPTKEEWEELVDNCSWKHYTRNGVDGMLATSTVPGYSSAHIFFPFSGQKDGDELRKVGSMGYYWTSSLSPFSSMGCIGTTTPDTGYLERYIGLPIRPVYDDK